MPERVHHRFQDAPPPAKKLKTQQPEPTSISPLNDQRPEQRYHKPPYPKTQQPQRHPNLKDKANTLLRFRQELPIWAHAPEIRKSLRSKDVLLLVGETGSGKSTQVPQFLVEEPWCTSQSTRIRTGDREEVVKVGGCIAITEPRRVAAITLARRVAEEMATPLGSSSPASKVGYSVRFDNSTSPSTRIKFLTEGMLLQEMLRDPWLRQYSAVVVDEVHERGVNVDLLMGFVRRIVSGEKEGRGGIPLKVAVMSATADLEGLQRFFDDGFGLTGEMEGSRGSRGIVGEFVQHSADAEETGSEWSGFSASADEEREIKVNGYASQHEDTTIQSELSLNGKEDGTRLNTIAKGDLVAASNKPADNIKRGSENVSICYIEGRQYPVQTVYSPQPVPDFVDAALRTIFQIHYKEPLPGDILVFLTGQETVESLETLVTEYAQGLGPEVPKLLVLPLFAALPQAAQQRVFHPPPSKTRKVILATNIAETSITVSGVRFVIDCGKSKIKQFRTRLGLDSLLVKPISKSAAIQRKGRAGREAPGKCYRLYTEPDYDALPPANTPEILRSDLSQALLTIKAHGIDDIMTFPFLDRPPRDALEKALLQLLQLGALDPTGSISPIGLQIATLPLTAPLGRVLLAAADPAMACLAEAIDIIACLSVENIFLNLTSDDAKELAETARRALFRREGDHLTLLATVQAYAAERADRKAWAERHFVSHRAMQAVMDVRKQLLVQAQHLRLSSTASSSSSRSHSVFTADASAPAQTRPETAINLLKCFLKGFATNTARISPDGSYRTLVGNQVVGIHPSSVLFGKKVEAVVYNEFVFTNRSYARGVSAVQMDWVGEVLGL
ncbi:putative ATP-dependent RNA helicase dhr2 [Ptychographa xylographoides]|nr:putative ATP-dependent RNA helicase dhr2 [Ptychographa xylographoides]